MTKLQAEIAWLLVMVVAGVMGIRSRDPGAWISVIFIALLGFRLDQGDRR